MNRRAMTGALGLMALAGCTTTHEENVVNQVTHNHYAASERVEQETAEAIDTALNAVYAAISGPVGQDRDWDAMRALFTPDARLTAITPRGLMGGTVEDYIGRSGPVLVQSGFTERQLDRRLEVYGDLAHAWSSYEGHFTGTDGKPASVRGINSFQLVRQADGRWLVQSIFWQAETPDNPLPDDLSGR